MAPKLFGSEEMSGVFWTLFIEIIFYGLCTFLFLLKCLDKSIVIALVALALNLTTPICSLGNKYFYLNLPVQFILFHLSFLFAGNLLRLAFVKKDKIAAYSISIFLILYVLIVPIVSGLLFSVPEAKDKGFVMFGSEAVAYAYALAIGLFIVTVHYKSISNRFMVSVGEVSYSLYLLHMLCFVLVMKFVQPETIPSFIVFIGASAFLSYSVAKLSFNFVEYPAIELGRRIIKSRGYAG